MMEQPTLNGASNGIPHGLPHSPSEEELERELPFVSDGQVPLAELVSRMAQAIYAELTELAETMPHMSDAQRKRTLAEWVVKTKKQVVKLYAVVKWSRDAAVVQKAMNVTAFLMDQNRQFEEAINGLKFARDSLDPARLRNHDILTSLDVLTTGTYRRLPSAIKKNVIPLTPLSSEEIARTLANVEDVMRYRLRMHELIPREMCAYRIADGRVFFTAPKLFEVSLCLKGAKPEDGWFFVDVDFLFNVGGDVTGMQEFPRRPTGALKRHIADEADGRLAFYLPPPEDAPPPPEEHQRPQLPEGVFDAPLVRLFNFLQMMSMSYQLEILWYQAERLRSLGWADYLTIQMSTDRRTLTLSYWIRKPPPTIPGRPRPKFPSLGGTLTISVIPTQPAPPIPTLPSSLSIRTSVSQSLSQLTSSQSQHPMLGQQPPPKSHRSPRDRVLAELQERAKLGGKAQAHDLKAKPRPSDEVDGFKFAVKWEPERNALGIQITPEDGRVPPRELIIDADDLDVEAILRKVIYRHTTAILSVFQTHLQHGNYRSVFGPPGEVVLVTEEGALALRTHLCADEVVIITIDPRTGRISMRDTGDLAAAGRGPRFSVISDAINLNPIMLPEALVRLRFNTITELAEQKASYLGLRCFRQRNFARDELRKLGDTARNMLYIQLATFPQHYLVLVITDTEFRYALISVKEKRDSLYAELIMEDIGWLDVQRIHGEEVVIHHRSGLDGVAGVKRKRSVYEDDLHGPVLPNVLDQQRASASFRLETQVLRELYAYCCARVAYTKVEMQLKSRAIAYKHVNPTVTATSLATLAHVHSSLARSIPSLCVQSSDILSGAPAAEAAMPNIRVIPLNWWSERKAQVVTCVKLKYVQQPVGKRAGDRAVIRPSNRIIYDTREAVVTFLSEDVDKCVDEFLEEWARVSKMVVIAREVAQMATKHKWHDVRLLSFDLQTVEFAYMDGYTVSITCVDQLSPTGGSFELSFSRRHDIVAVADETSADIETILAQYNPHEDVEPFLRAILRKNPLSQALHRLVSLLRETLPIVAELEYIRVKAEKDGDNVEIFAKTAGWFRVLYGDLRYALDFRLMSRSQILVVDGSNSLFQAGERVMDDASLTLQPIPDFRSIVLEASKNTSIAARRKIVSIDIGVICHSSAVRTIGRALHHRIQERLKQDIKGAITV